MPQPAFAIPEIVGHRGAAGEAPENTIAGLQHAIAQGVRHVEIDLRLSADQQLVVIHDHNLQRTTGHNGTVSEFDAATLNTFPAINSFSNSSSTWQTNALGISTLAQLMASTTELESYQLEIKSDEHTNTTALVNALAEFFPSADSAKKVIITSFDVALISQLKQLCPHLKTGIIAKQYASKAIEAALTLNCHHLCLHYMLALNNTELIHKALTANTLHVSVWTVNEPQLLPPLMQIPVNSVITDVPTVMFSALQTLK
jgi:glycerophosphoryl diester phosphodiesterase